MNDNKYIKEQLKLGIKTAEDVNVLDDIKKTYSDNPEIYKPKTELTQNNKTETDIARQKVKRKILALASSLAAIVLVVSLGVYFLVSLNANSLYEYQAGNGSVTDPYIIMTKEQLIYFRDKTNTVNSYSQNIYFALGSDINLENIEWIPIEGFKGGNFNGKGYKIYNFKITQNAIFDNPKAFGLFGNVYDATIENLGVSGFNINITEPSDLYEVYAGGLAAHVSGCTISNCYAIGNVSVISNGGSTFAGGLLGYIDDASISDCYAVVNVSATGEWSACFSGGLIAFVSNGTISNCYATGNVTAISSGNVCAGGLVGAYTESTLNNCYRFDEQIIDADGALPIEGPVFPQINTEGLECNLSDLNSPEFYTEILVWDSSIWDFTGLDFTGGKYPELINAGLLS